MNQITNLQDIEMLEAQGLPADLPANTYEMIQHGARINPDAPALSFFLSADEHRNAEQWSYRELLANITQTANFFHEIGVTKDTVVAFVLPNLPETHFTIWGGEAAGIVFAVNPLLEAPAIAELLSAAKTRVLVTLAPFPGTDLWSKLSGILQQVPTLQHVVLVNLADRVRRVKATPGASAAHQADAHLHAELLAAMPEGVQLHDFTAGIARQEATSLISGRQIASSDTASYFCTGGTTGLPKIAARTHGNEVANIWSVGQALGDGFSPGQVIFCGLPLFHVNGVLVTGLLPFFTGAHVILGTPQGFRGEGVVRRFWEMVEQHRINCFSGVPTLYASLLQVPTTGYKLDSLRYGICGAAPMPVEVFRSFQERTGLKILEGYGLTEGTCVSSVNPPLGEQRLGSIGLRVPGQQMKTVVLDDQGGWVRDCAVDEVGVLALSGPNVFKGYLVPEQNIGLWIDCGDGQRWVNTGDLARQDAQGYVWLTGRKKELIIRGGHNIDPASIEGLLHQHPAVQLAAAVGRPDAYAGELPVAYVQLKVDAQVSEAELLEFLKQEITERAAVPKAVRIIEQMPLTGVGKIFKPTLKMLEAQDALESALSAAGIAIGNLQVGADNSKGMVATVTLGAAPEADVRRVLGQFPLQITIQPGL